MTESVRAQHDLERAAVRPLMQLSPEITDRAALTGSDGVTTVRYFVLTRSAERAWAAINHQLVEPKGAFFWLTGPAGSGKSHFLNYVAELNTHAGEIDNEPGRDLTLTFVVTDAIDECERSVAIAIAHALGEEKKAARLWRDLPGRDALRIALDGAKRQGVRAITLLIDYGDREVQRYLDAIRSLVTIATSVKTPRVIVVAAGHGELAIKGVQTFALGYGPDEEARVVVGRARYLAESDAAAHAARRDQSGGHECEELVPFEAEAVQTLLGLVTDEVYRVAAAARLARAVLMAGPTNAMEGSIGVTDLLACAAIRETVEAKLGAGGVAAMRIAQAAAQQLGPAKRVIADKIVAAVVLRRACGLTEGISGATLAAMLEDQLRGAQEDASARLMRLVDELAALSQGTIAYDRGTRTVYFNPDAASAPQLSAFNAALPLLRRFDATLMPAHDAIELENTSDRLRQAMAAALEDATRNRDALSRAGQEFGAPLRPEQLRCFDEYLAITEAGPITLIAACGQPERQAAYTICMNEYDTLVALAAALPRLRAMRDYLQRTELDHGSEDPALRTSPYGHLATEACLLQHDLSGSTRAKAVATLNALEARFERFKWTYAPAYQTAHDEWCLEIERAMLTVDEIREYLAALARLNGIARLGAPEGAELAGQLAALEPRVVPCRLEGPLAPELTPRCPRCNYVLGTMAPREALSDLLARVRRAVTVKLTALSQSAIARLIHDHDRDNRLEGFLRIVQAAQTDALVRVFDDNLARYLGALLEDNHRLPEARTVFRRKEMHPLPIASARPRQTKLSPRS